MFNLRSKRTALLNQYRTKALSKHNRYQNNLSTLIYSDTETITIEVNPKIDSHSTSFKSPAHVTIAKYMTMNSQYTDWDIMDIGLLRSLKLNGNWYQRCYQTSCLAESYRDHYRSLSEYKFDTDRSVAMRDDTFNIPPNMANTYIERIPNKKDILEEAQFERRNRLNNIRFNL